MLKPIGITHVLYESQDLIAKVLAYYSLVPIALIVSLVTLIVVNRDVRLFGFLLGQVANEGINFALKRTLKQPRPAGISIDVDLGKGYGMPSSHSQFAWFFCIFWFYYIRSYKTHWLVQLIVLKSALLVSISRVYLGYHTVEQIVVGGVLGSMIALGWILVYRRVSLVKIKEE